MESKSTNDHISKQEDDKLVNDLYDVGPNKPLGYLPIDTLIDICKLDPDSVQKDLNQKGLKTIRLNMAESGVANNGALYAYDEESLGHLLGQNRSTLEESGWPTETEKFVRYLNHYAPRKTKIFDLVADAYADKKNDGRTDIPEDI